MPTEFMAAAVVVVVVEAWCVRARACVRFEGLCSVFLGSTVARREISSMKRERERQDSGAETRVARLWLAKGSGREAIASRRRSSR
jgi:hypothetical protein